MQRKKEISERFLPLITENRDPVCKEKKQVRLDVLAAVGPNNSVLY